MSRPIGTTIYSVNHGFFDRPSILNCYWAGFLAADAALTPNRNNVRLGISTKDERHLKRFCDDIGFTGPIRYSNDLCIAEIYSIHWRRDLEKYFHIVPRKSLILKPPIGLSYKKALAFITGYIDGDGWRTQSRNTPAIGVQGTQAMLTWIAEFINMHFPATRKNTQPTKRSDAECWQMTFYGHRVENLVREVKLLGIPIMERKWHE